MMAKRDSPPPPNDSTVCLDELHHDGSRSSDQADPSAGLRDGPWVTDQFGVSRVHKGVDGSLCIACSTYIDPWLDIAEG